MYVRTYSFMHTTAGLCAYSLINLLPGGHTNATGNSAARGGAAALVDATLIVQPGHTLTAQENAAQSRRRICADRGGGPRSSRGWSVPDAVCVVEQG